MSHLVHIVIVAIVATLVTLFAGVGIGFGSTMVAGALTASVLSSVTVAVGVFSLVMARQKLGLLQAGRLLQMLLYWLLVSLAWALVGMIPQSLLVVTNPWLAGLAVLVLTTLGGWATGGFNSTMRRTWLPVMMPKKK